MPSPFGSLSVAPNFTTSQTVANNINPTVNAGGFNAGTYISGTGPSISSGSGGSAMKVIWWGLGILAVGGGLFWFFKRKKPSGTQ